jgi:hypothetical protein
MADSPPLPPGFTLDVAAQAMPPLPPGFTLDSPQQQMPEVTATDRAGAFAAGVNSGVAGLAGVPVDTMANVRDLAKAGAGVMWGMFSKEDGKPILREDGKPAWYDIGENGELIPAMTPSVTRIPNALQLTDRSQDIGSGEYLRAQMNKLTIRRLGTCLLVVSRFLPALLVRALRRSR